MNRDATSVVATIAAVGWRQHLVEAEAQGIDPASVEELRQVSVVDARRWLALAGLEESPDGIAGFLACLAMFTTDIGTAMGSDIDDGVEVSDAHDRLAFGLVLSSGAAAVAFADIIGVASDLGPGILPQGAQAAVSRFMGAPVEEAQADG